MNSLTASQLHILQCLESCLFDGKPLEIPAECLPAVFMEAIQQAVFPQVFAQLQGQLTQNESALWQNRYLQILAGNAKVNYEHHELHTLMQGNGIPYVIMKGLASASYYPEPELRTMGDVDFLVQKEDKETVDALLRGIGFSSDTDRDEYHVAYHRNRSSWEMHDQPNGVPDGAAGECLREYLSDVIQSSVDYDDGTGSVRIPDAFHHGLILLLHTAAHLTSEGVGLRHLCDWAVFQASLSNEEFIRLFEVPLKECGLWRFAQLLTLCSIRYLGAPEREWAGQTEDSLLEEMICDIISGGNFGTKDETRPQQIKFIADRGERTVSQKSPLLQVWNTIGQKAKLEKKTRIRVMFDYGMMVVQGKRKLDSKQTIDTARQRKKLYTEFHLFEGTSSKTNV